MREPQLISLHTMLHHTFMTWFALTFSVSQNADFTAQPSITIEDDDGPTPNEEIQTETGVKPYKAHGEMSPELIRS